MHHWLDEPTECSTEDYKHRTKSSSTPTDASGLIKSLSSIYIPVEIPGQLFILNTIHLTNEKLPLTSFILINAPTGTDERTVSNARVAPGV